MKEKYTDETGHALIDRLTCLPAEDGEEVTAKDVEEEFNYVDDDTIVISILKDFWNNENRFCLPIQNVKEALNSIPVVKVARVFRPLPAQSKFKRPTQFTVNTKDPVVVFWKLYTIAKEKADKDPVISKSKWAFKYTAK